MGLFGGVADFGETEKAEITPPFFIKILHKVKVIILCNIFIKRGCILEKMVV